MRIYHNAAYRTLKAQPKPIRLGSERKSSTSFEIPLDDSYDAWIESIYQERIRR